MHAQTTLQHSGEGWVKVKILKPLNTLDFYAGTCEGKKDMNVRAHVFVSGRVQGVFFRSEVKRKADSYGVKGWVCNLPDFRVEAVFEGEEEAVKALVEFCRRGPSGARVTNVDLTWENCTGEFVGFKIKHGQLF
jgi:acylphosphatase